MLTCLPDRQVLFYKKYPLMMSSRELILSMDVIISESPNFAKGKPMKNILLISLFGFSSLVFPQKIYDNLDSLLSNASRLDIFSGVVLIADKDSVNYLKAYGDLDWDRNIPNRTDTKFNIGSIGKLFTQILITQLIQEGKLSLSDNLEKLYPIYHNENDKKITVKLLLTFSAGPGDYFQIKEFQQHPDSYRDVKDLAELISKEPLLYEPGTSNKYSNSSYVILGGIIEKITGKTYLQNLMERILVPLGMNNSGFIYKDSKTVNTAKGFIVTPDGRKESTYERTPSVPTPAGGMYSTAEDLLKLDRSLMNDNKLLADDLKALLLNRFDEKRKETWAEMKAKPDFGIGVAGGSPGWNAVYDQNVNGKYTVIVLSNFDMGAESIMSRIHAVLKDEKYPPLQVNMGRFIYKKIRENGTEDFVINYKEYLSSFRINNDMILNRTGYQLLNAGYTDEAIAVFLVNTKYFPDVANTYDSLGEAYMVKGDKENAITNYKKSLELDPDNKNAEKTIQMLEGK